MKDRLQNFGAFVAKALETNKTRKFILDRDRIVIEATGFMPVELRFDDPNWSIRDDGLIEHPAPTQAHLTVGAAEHEDV